MKRLILFAVSAAALILPVSCARTVSDPQNYSTDRRLDAWIRENCGAIEKDTSGTYILELEEGTGRKIGDSSYIFTKYVRKNLDQAVASTNVPELMQKMGRIDRTTYLGPRIWRVGKGMLPTGLESTIRRVREGGRIKVAMPVGKSGVTSSTYNAFNSSETDNVIYEIEVERVLDDIKAYEDSLLRDYSKKYYGGQDSVFDAFYWIREGFRADADTIADEDVLGIRYIGRRLDGQVFDTNLKDSAAMYRLTNTSADTLSFTYYRDSAKMYNSNTKYIPAFSLAINRMKHFDTITVFFSSYYGYGASGSGATIPEYSPMCFKIFIQEVN